MIISSRFLSKIPRISADFSFFVFTALLFLFRDSQTVYGFINVCIIHELGHFAAIMFFGVKIKHIKLSFFGICIETEKGGRSTFFSSTAILLSGPAANIILFILLELSGIHHDTAILSLVTGIYNLLPFSSLDGGAAAELFITGSEHERFYRILLKIVRILIVSILIIIMMREQQLYRLMQYLQM